MTQAAPHQGMIHEEAGGLSVWRWPDAGPQSAAPQQITRAQGKAALIVQGLWSAVLGYVGAIQDPTQRALAEVALHDTLTWERSSPFLNAAAAGLGMTGEQLDALFIQASEITL